MTMKPAQKLAVLFITIVVPYIALVFYVGVVGLKNLPDWTRWALPAYFAASIVGLSVGISKFRTKSLGDVAPQTQANPQNSRNMRPVKRLLIMYLVFFPLAVAGALLQKEIPIKFALLALAVPVLVMGSLWNSIRRARSAGHGGSSSQH
jgi:hypothetical protein